MILPQLEEENQAVFGPVTQYKNYGKKELVLAPEQTERYIYYVLQGSAAMFVENDGEEICIGFYTEGHFLCDYVSFLLQKPNATYIRSIEPLRLAAISYDDLQASYEISKEHERIGRKVSEQLYIQVQQRSLDLLTLSAEERYLKMIKERPESLQRIPLKYLASYLGMTAVSLSRIRKKLLG